MSAFGSSLAATTWTHHDNYLKMIMGTGVKHEARGPNSARRIVSCGP